MATIKDIMESLKKIFKQQNRSTRQTAMKGLMSTKNVEGTSVGDHAKNIIGI